MTEILHGYSGEWPTTRLLASLGTLILFGVVLTTLAAGSGVFLHPRPQPIRIVLPEATAEADAVRNSEIAATESAEVSSESEESANRPPAVGRGISDLKHKERSAAVATKRIGDVEMLGLSYALPAPKDLGRQGIKVKKKLVVKGFGSRMVDIYIHSGSRIEIDGAQLTEALVGLGALSEQQAKLLPVDQGRQTFTAVRAAGIDLGYDANSDSLVLDPGQDGIAAANAATSG